ncbi:MAG: 6-bladed beta-propeller, partial [Cytophagales bacterium]|nr:6-bladed beta-propeller [Cytophagales bacterium]
MREFVIKVFFVLTLCVSCNKHNEQAQSYNDSTIHISIADVPESEYKKADSVKFIPLETSEDCLIGNVDKFMVSEERIFVADMKIGNALFIFDNEGRLIKKYAAHGKGSKEFQGKIQDFDVKDQIFLVTDAHEVICLSLDGDFKWKKSAGRVFSTRTIAKTTDGFCFGQRCSKYMPFNEEKDMYYDLVRTDNNFNIRKKMHPIVFEQAVNMIWLSHSFTSHDNTVYFVPNVSDSIRVFGNEKNMTYKVDFGYGYDPIKIRNDKEYVKNLRAEDKLSYISKIIRVDNNMLVFSYYSKG